MMQKRNDLINTSESLQNGLKSKSKHKHAFTYSFQGQNLLNAYPICNPIKNKCNPPSPPPSPVIEG